MSENGSRILGAKVPSEYRDEFLKIASEKYNLPHSEVLRTLVISFVDNMHAAARMADDKT